MKNYGKRVVSTDSESDSEETPSNSHEELVEFQPVNVPTIRTKNPSIPVLTRRPPLVGVNLSNFTLLHLQSKIKPQDLDHIRTRYSIPSDIIIIVPDPEW